MQRSLRRADHSSRGVLPTVVCLSVIVKPQPRGGPGLITSCRPIKKDRVLSLRQQAHIYRCRWSWRIQSRKEGCHNLLWQFVIEFSKLTAFFILGEVHQCNSVLPLLLALTLPQYDTLILSRHIPRHFLYIHTPFFYSSIITKRAHPLLHTHPAHYAALVYVNNLFLFHSFPRHLASCKKICFRVPNSACVFYSYFQHGQVRRLYRAFSFTLQIYTLITYQ